MQPPSKPMISMEKSMFKNAMCGDWDAVEKVYGGQQKQMAKITKAGDTVLHVAITNGNEDVLRSLINKVADANVLGLKNNRGNTPLHYAAALGSVSMCSCIIEKQLDLESTKVGNNGGEAEKCEKRKKLFPFMSFKLSQLDWKNRGKEKGKEKEEEEEEEQKVEWLISVRNNDGETPLFVAALRGHKDAFVYLFNKYNGDALTLCRRNDGDTILHSAISGEFFDLAFFITEKFPDLANYVNQSGDTPLDVLAHHPYAFKSGCQLNLYDHVVYFSTWVDPLSMDSNSQFQPFDKKKELPFKIPENYDTCLNIFKLFRRLFANLELTLKNTPSPEPKLVEIAITENQVTGNTHEDSQEIQKSTHGHLHQYFPHNYGRLFEIIKFAIKLLLIVLGIGLGRTQWVMEQKRKHVWAQQVMVELILKASNYEYEDTGGNPTQGGRPSEDVEVKDEPTKQDKPNIEPTASSKDGDAPGSNRDSASTSSLKNEKDNEELQDMELLLSDSMGDSELVEKLLQISPMVLQYNKGVGEKKVRLTVARDTKQPERTKETAILAAAKMGIVEMVKKILETFPVAIQDTNEDGKNIVHLAVENRQPLVYKYLINPKVVSQTVFQEIDKAGNTALHLAARLGVNSPWLIPGAAMQMQWEIKWFKFVQNSMAPNFFTGFNKEGNTPEEIFTNTHTDLVKEGGAWLTNTSQSCSVVAALIAGVAFATAVTVPGGPDEKTGHPLLEKQSPFDIFALSSLVALCSSVTSLVVFLSILTSRYEPKDFYISLPRKLLAGLSSLFLSIAAILVSFCAGHFFVLKDELRYAAYPAYAITCLPITYFALAQFPLYLDLVKSSIKKVPQRTSKSLSI